MTIDSLENGMVVVSGSEELKNVNSVENDIRFASLNYGKLGWQEVSYEK